MKNSHDENRCSNCKKRKDARHGVDAFKGTRTCFSEAVKDDDIVCMNFEQEEDRHEQ